MLGCCPECQESIRIPDGSPDLEVRCPLCGAEYKLQRVIESLPPMLEQIGVSAGPANIQIDSDDDVEIAHARETSSGPGHRPRYQPRKKKESSAFAEIIKVILGGVVAIPVGILCVWWFAGRAPFGVAETVSKYAPWIVPEKLRQGDQVDESDLGPNIDAKSQKSLDRQVKAFRRNAANRKPNRTPSSGSLGITRSVADADGPSRPQENPNKTKQKESREPGSGTAVGLPQKVQRPEPPGPEPKTTDKID